MRRPGAAPRVYLFPSRSRKYSSLEMPAVLRLFRMMETGTCLYVGMITGRSVPGLT